MAKKAPKKLTFVTGAAEKAFKAKTKRSKKAR